MDNASTNDVVARCLQEHYSFRGVLLVNGSNIQVRCWNHVLNLIVQEGLDEINDCIHMVRNAVKYVRGSAKRKLEFLHYADQECISRGKMLSLDICTRWNSTYLMLESALHYRRAYDRMKTRDLNFKDPPLADDWEKARIVHDFLETFYTVTKIFSGSKYCTANVFLRVIYHVFMLLRETSIENSPLLGSMASNMLVKIEKYWLEKEPNILLSVAFVLDPRFKMRKLKTIFSKIYESYLAPYMLDRVHTTLQDLFIEYVKVYEVSC
ncbi:zinc finger BED domain-containing protein RICESLEEPER 2-like [Coffea eugenioides]|uniref:zinc finger BED domain-containing protein RICESLEEPER 2-like n=1 Tax=Coffea eugenioides TaxID=49369 RepID=UPI000F613408|nr:zinc finger BED domain-containing protein RICESLEEPER 2-like [Coffea eugenioides]